MEYEEWNPKGKMLEDLPIIYGFNNGGPHGFLEGMLITQDGDVVGGHICSNESFMIGDLGVLKCHRPDRHEKFREIYQNGYRMDFVSYDDVPKHAGLQAAFAAARAKSTGDAP